VRIWDSQTNRWTGSIYIVASDGSASAVRLTYCKDKTDDNPTWSADSTTLFFISNRSGKRQIHYISINHGESCQLTAVPVDVASMRLSPSGTAICFQCEVNNEMLNIYRLSWFRFFLLIVMMCSAKQLKC